MSRPLRLAGILIVAAAALAVIGLVLSALRWLLIVAAVIVVIGAVLGAAAQRRRANDG